MATNIMESDAYSDLLEQQEQEGILKTDVVRDVYFKVITKSDKPVGLL